ncbi:perilipin-3-like [Ahaetulla prasina]|uniref:perilipin-3-like n=1 Tax=Ahaetulla prasina TaxID=499056 RepID=UPI002648062B|nr:perilipin-3-like [Ahaetulla prasina]XP_058019578.1 perilipin-3-like [Ahaetulla prasina]
MATEGENQNVTKTENIVTRVTNLPLVSSAYEVWSSVYQYAKKTYPCVNTACNIVEMVAAVAVGSARGGAQPLLPHLEPQIATVNEYACKGLDSLEKKLPILQQPTYQVFEDGVTLTKTVVSSTVHAAGEAKGRMTQKVTKAVDLTKDIVQDGIALTKSVVSSTVSTARHAANEAKGLVTHRAADMINLGKETVNEGVDLTRSVVSKTVNAARQVQSSGAVQEGVEMATLFRQAVASGVDTMLEKTEELVDYYLPMSAEELAQLANQVQGVSLASMDEQRKEQSYFIRLGSLSSKLRSRVYRHSLNRLHVVQEKTQDLLGQIQYVINLIEHLKDSAGSQFQEAQQKLHQILLKWIQIQPEEDQERREAENSSQQVESATLAMLRSLIQDLSPAYTWLMSTVEVLPRNLRERVDQTQSNFHHLHRSFSSAESFQDLPSGFLAQSQEMISHARDVLRMLAEHLVQITPLNWIVGPFRPQEGGSGASREESRTGRLKETGKEVRESLSEKVAVKKMKRMQDTTEVDPRESTEAMGALKELLEGSEGAPQEKN